MANAAEEEIEDTDLDEQDNSEEEEEKDEDGAADEGDESSKKDGKGDDSEEDEDDESDSDEDDEKPLTAAESKQLRAFLKRQGNKSSAAARISQKRDLLKPGSKDNERLSSLEKSQQQLLRNEEKRQFGYKSNLSPDEVDVVFRLTKRPTIKSLSDPIIKGALQGYREDKRLKANVPGSGGANRGSGRPSDRNNRKDEVLTPAERKDRFVSRRQEILSSKRGQ